MSHSFRCRLGAVILALLAPSAALVAQDLTGIWRDDHGGRYVVRQAGEDFCWSSEPTNVYCGLVIGKFISGRWLDLPTGRFKGSGTMVLQIDSPNRLTKIHQTANYGATVWTREGTIAQTANPATPPAAPPPPPPPAPPAASGPAAKSGGVAGWDTRPQFEELGAGRLQLGDRIRYSCGPMPSNRPDAARVWGNGYYTTSSFVCDAAVHAGVIPPTGGSFIVTIAGEQSSFAGGLRNGVQSYPYEAAQPNSLTFSPDGGAVQVDRDMGAGPPRSAGTVALNPVEARFVGSWVCACKITIVLNADRTGSFVDRRGGPPGSLYESGTFTGTWSAATASVTLDIPVARWGRRGGVIQLSLIDGKLHDPWGDVYAR